MRCWSAITVAGASRSRLRVIQLRPSCVSCWAGLISCVVVGLTITGASQCPAEPRELPSHQERDHRRWLGRESVQGRHPRPRRQDRAGRRSRQDRAEPGPGAARRQGDGRRAGIHRRPHARRRSGRSAVRRKLHPHGRDVDRRRQLRRIGRRRRRRAREDSHDARVGQLRDAGRPQQRPRHGHGTRAAGADGGGAREDEGPRARRDERGRGGLLDRIAVHPGDVCRDPGDRRAREGRGRGGRRLRVAHAQRGHGDRRSRGGDDRGGGGGAVPRPDLTLED